MDNLYVSKEKMEGDLLPGFGVILRELILPKYSGTGVLLQKNTNWKDLKLLRILYYNCDLKKDQMEAEKPPAFSVKYFLKLWTFSKRKDTFTKNFKIFWGNNRNFSISDLKLLVSRVHRTNEVFTWELWLVHFAESLFCIFIVIKQNTSSPLPWHQPGREIWVEGRGSWTSMWWCLCLSMVGLESKDPWVFPFVTNLRCSCLSPFSPTLSIFICKLDS